jgi:tetratricopeptide (TPR) repeat protein
VTVYLMELAAAANQLGQLDTLFNMYFSPNSAGEQPGIRATYIALYRRRIGSAAPRRGWPDPVDDPELAQVALSRIGADVRDRNAARAYARVVASAPASRVNGLLALATLAVADGAWSTAAGHIADAALLDPEAASEHRALLALAPSVKMSADSLRAVRQALLAARPTRVSNGDALTFAERGDVRQYLVGLLSVRLGDSAGVASALAALARRSAADSRLALPLSRAIVGQAHLRSGNLTAALEAFEQCTPDVPARLRARYPVLAQHTDRLARAETLQRLGRGRDAIEWYRSVGEGAGLGVAGTPFVAAADSGARRAGRR